MEKPRGPQQGGGGPLDAGRGSHPPCKCLQWCFERVLFPASRETITFCTQLSRGFAHSILSFVKKNLGGGERVPGLGCEHGAKLRMRHPPSLPQSHSHHSRQVAAPAHFLAPVTRDTPDEAGPNTGVVV